MTQSRYGSTRSCMLLSDVSTNTFTDNALYRTVSIRSMCLQKVTVDSCPDYRPLSWLQRSHSKDCTKPEDRRRCRKFSKNIL